MTHFLPTGQAPLNEVRHEGHTMNGHEAVKLIDSVTDGEPGHEDIQCDVFEAAVRDLDNGYLIPGLFDDRDEEESAADFLCRALGDDTIGEGEPIAYVGVAGFFTLIRETATAEQIESEARRCLPSWRVKKSRKRAVQ